MGVRCEKKKERFREKERDVQFIQSSNITHID
jgi:hypothetical protein